MSAVKLSLLVAFIYKLQQQ